MTTGRDEHFLGKPLELGRNQIEVISSVSISLLNGLILGPYIDNWLIPIRISILSWEPVVNLVI